MAFSPDSRNYGEAKLTINSATGARIVTATHAGGTTWPGAHVDGDNFVVNIAESTTGTAPPTGNWSLAVVEDSTDVSGNYFTATPALTSGVLAIVSLGAGGSLNGLSRTIGNGSNTLFTGSNPAIQKGGTYRLVLMAGQGASGTGGVTNSEQARVSDVDTGGTSTEYHYDSDGNSAAGGLSLTVAATTRNIGGCGHTVQVTAITPTAGNWRYRQTNQVAVSIRPTGFPSAAIINPKEFKVALTTDTAGSTRQKLGRVTPNTTGDATFGSILVDTDFGQTVMGSSPTANEYVQVGVGDVLGDSSNPTNELAGIWSTGTIVGVTTAQRSPYVFTTTGTTPDTSGNGRTGTLVGAIKPTASASGMSFDGVDRDDSSSGVNCGVTGFGVSTADGSMQIKATITRSRTGVSEIIAGKWKSTASVPTANTQYLLYVDMTNLLTFVVVNSGGTIIAAGGTTALAVGTTYIVEGNWTGSVLNVKVNGVQEGTTPSITALQTPDAITPFTIGRGTWDASDPNGPYPFQGTIKDVSMTRGGVLQGQWALTSITSSDITTSVTAAKQTRSNNKLFAASAAIQAFKDTGLTQAGVGCFSSSGYTTAQDIFKRTGTVNTTNAIPFLEVYLADAFNAKLVSLTNAFTGDTQRMSDSGSVNSQTLSTDANGRIRWNYTINATSAAFNRFIKNGVTRATGSHVATGPDNPASPPATFSNGNGAYGAPFPGYGRKVVMSGTGFSSGKEPSVTTNNVFGVNSEIIFEDMWTGSAVNEQEDVNGCPNGPGQREQTLGAGSLKAKLTTLIDEGTVRVITPSEYNPKDVAGRNIDLAGAEVLQGRRALWNISTSNADDPGTNLSNSLNLDTPLGYATGSASFDSIAAPADPASLIYYQFYKDWANGNEATEDASGFLLTSNSNVGMQTDQGNFAYFAQNISFVSVDLTISIALTPKVAQQAVRVPVRFGAKVLRVAADDTLNDVHPDSAPIYVCYGLNDDGSQTQTASGSMTAVGNPATTADYYFDVTIPTGYSAVKVKAFAKVNGSRTPGGDASVVQIGWQFDPIGTFTGFQFK